jgi:TolB-like protein
MLGGRPTKPAVAAHLSIVVLPFANLSGDPAQDYLVDALTDELTTSLVRITGNFVIARNTAMTFKSMPVDAKAIGKELSVRYVLEGSVQHDPDLEGWYRLRSAAYFGLKQCDQAIEWSRRSIVDQTER